MSNLFFVDEGVLLATFLVLMLVGAECGYRWGRQRAQRASDPISSHLTHEASALGVLALILAFTFSMAATRFDARRAIVLDEANAIGTAALRADFLPPDLAAAARGLLADYADARVALYDAGADDGLRDAALSRSERLHAQIWNVAVQAVTRNRAEVPAVSFAHAVNTVIDQHGARKSSYGNHIPDVVYLLVYCVGFVAFVLSGVASGLQHYRSRLPTAMMAVLVSVVVFLVTDLDRPQRGILRISDASMIELAKSLRRTP